MLSLTSYLGTGEYRDRYLGLRIPTTNVQPEQLEQTRKFASALADRLFGRGRRDRATKRRRDERHLQKRFAMPHSFDILTESPASVEQVHAAFSREDYWLARHAAFDVTSTLDSLIVEADGTVTVRATQHLGRQLLPGLLAKLVPGDLKILHRETWRPVGDRRVRGRSASRLPRRWDQAVRKRGWHRGLRLAAAVRRDGGGQNPAGGRQARELHRSRFG